MQKRWYHRFLPDTEVLVQLECIKRQIDLVIKNQGIIMNTLADAQAAQATTDTKIAAIAADVQVLLGKLTTLPTPGTLTPEQQAAIDDIVAHAGRINDALSAVDASANPTPAPQA